MTTYYKNENNGAIYEVSPDKYGDTNLMYMDDFTSQGVIIDGDNSWHYHTWDKELIAEIENIYEHGTQNFQLDMLAAMGEQFDHDYAQDWDLELSEWLTETDVLSGLSYYGMSSLFEFLDGRISDMQFTIVGGFSQGDATFVINTNTEFFGEISDDELTAVLYGTYNEVFIIERGGTPYHEASIAWDTDVDEFMKSEYSAVEIEVDIRSMLVGA